MKNLRPLEACTWRFVERINPFKLQETQMLLVTRTNMLWHAQSTGYDLATEWTRCRCSKTRLRHAAWKKPLKRISHVPCFMWYPWKAYAMGRQTIAGDGRKGELCTQRAVLGRYMLVVVVIHVYKSVNTRRTRHKVSLRCLILVCKTSLFNVVYYCTACTGTITWFCEFFPPEPSWEGSPSLASTLA